MPPPHCLGARHLSASVAARARRRSYIPQATTAFVGGFCVGHRIVYRLNNCQGLAVSCCPVQLTTHSSGRRSIARVLTNVAAPAPLNSSVRAQMSEGTYTVIFEEPRFTAQLQFSGL